MPSGLQDICRFNVRLLSLSASLAASCLALPGAGDLDSRASKINALRDPAYLPAQISGIVGSYAFSLLVVAILLLVLSRRRREHLQNADDCGHLIEAAFDPFPNNPFGLQFEADYRQYLEHCQCGNDRASPSTSRRNFSLPCNTSPASPSSATRPVSAPSPSSTVTRLAPGVDPAVDQSVVAQDRAMAQQDLENMYRHVMEQEEAKAQGRQYIPPQLCSSPTTSEQPSTPSPQGPLKEERTKPSHLNLAKEERPSRASSILSLLKSPRKKVQKGLDISSPVTLTPMSATLSRYEEQQRQSMSLRHCNPPPPPPVPSAYSRHPLSPRRTDGQLPPPDISPDGTQSIDERLGAALGSLSVARQGEDHGASYARPKPAPLILPLDLRPSETEADVVSAVSERSTRTAASPISERSTRTPVPAFVGLPTSPKPGVNRFSSLASPLPSAPLPSAPPTPHATTTFQRVDPPPAALRTGGLPLRAYEPSLASHSMASQTTKQTVFTRVGPLSPRGMRTARTPYTGAPVPYSPYQPFSPVVPITPSLVTREDRKRMQRMVPKTPTVEMVKSEDDMW